MLHFLTGLFETGVSYSTLGTARSAICNFVKICGGVNFSNDLYIQRFMRGVYLRKPSLPKYTEVWDVRLVLDYFNKLTNITLLQLSGKLSTLFLLNYCRHIEVKLYI